MKKAVLKSVAPDHPVSFFMSLVFSMACFARAGVSLPPGFTSTEIGSRLNSPTCMAVAPDGSILVGQQGGEIRIFRGDSLLPRPFLSISTRVSDEMGLGGIVLDPDYLRNGHVYLNFTSSIPPYQNGIHRFTARGDVAEPSSDTLLFQLDVPSQEYHLGGGLAFGSDGCLYIGTGDAGNPGRIRSLDNTFGKILRLRKDGSVPKDNPFVKSGSGQGRATWATGFRAIFSLAAQKESNRLFAFDVGNHLVEEINEVRPGGDYGWPTWEGPGLVGSNGISPFFSYSHGPGFGQGNAIAGGVFYPSRGGNFPDSLRSKLFFADYMLGWIRVLDLSRPSAANYFADHLTAPVALGLSPEGSLYCLLRGKVTLDGGTGRGWDVGSLIRIDYSSGLKAEIKVQPKPFLGSLGEPASFHLSVRSGSKVSYQWQGRVSAENGFSDIPGATKPVLNFPKVTVKENGMAVRCLVRTGANGKPERLASNSVSLTVVRDQRPRAFIESPAPGSQYIAGRIMTFSGGGRDPEEGILGPGGSDWQVEYHVEGHVHPISLSERNAHGGSFFISDSGEFSENVFYRILLRVTDKQGLDHSVFTDVLPKRVRLEFAAEPQGLRMLADGQELILPGGFSSVVGHRVRLEAKSPQWIDESQYSFHSWSGGKPHSHTIVSPDNDTKYVLRFVPKSKMRRAVEFILSWL